MKIQPNKYTFNIGDKFIGKTNTWVIIGIHYSLDLYMLTVTFNNGSGGYDSPAALTYTALERMVKEKRCKWIKNEN